MILNYVKKEIQEWEKALANQAAKAAEQKAEMQKVLEREKRKIGFKIP